MAMGFVLFTHKATEIQASHTLLTMSSMSLPVSLSFCQCTQGTGDNCVVLSNQNGCSFDPVDCNFPRLFSSAYGEHILWHLRVTHFFFQYYSLSSSFRMYD